MRLIFTTHDANQANHLANFLSIQNVENQLEITKNTDWSDTDYGNIIFKIWVIDEDLAETAEKWTIEFTHNPTNPLFQISNYKSGMPPTILPTDKGGTSSKGFGFIDLMNPSNKEKFKQPPLKAEPLGTLTLGFLMLCCLFYLISSITSPHITSIPNNLPAIPLVSAPIKKQFFYDYPHAYELIDRLVKIYGIEKLQTPNELPSEGQYILKEFFKTPYWEGYYNKLITHFKHIETPAPDTPLFEKIRQGEIWRLFTPCLMHSDFLHILFNMLWLMILGKQLEQRLNPRRYLFLILLIGMFSNTCQYLISGPNFIGFSGVICGMVTFIMVRQKTAPWEGYPLEHGTGMFIIYFITALLGIQLLSFYLEIYHNVSISPGIANTAHLTGAVIGALLGLLPFFKKSIKLRPVK